MREFSASDASRSSCRVELTPAGHRFHQHAVHITDAAMRAQDDMRALAQGLTGRVSVGFVGTATYDVLPDVARRVNEDLPDIELVLRGELLSPDLFGGIANGSYDLALLRPGQPQGPCRLQHLRSERLVAVLPSGHPLSGSDGVDLADLATEPFVIHPSGDHSSVHGRVLAACARAGFRPSRLREVGETATLVVFVAAGLGVALVPEPVKSLAVEGATYVPLAVPETVDLALASRPDDRSPATSLVPTPSKTRCGASGLADVVARSPRIAGAFAASRGACGRCLAP